MSGNPVQAVFCQKILKENGCICAGPLTYIINNDILNGKFDEGLKRADLIPLYKLNEYQLTSCHLKYFRKL